MKASLIKHHLKSTFFLLIGLSFLFSCEKDDVQLNENTEINEVIENKHFVSIELAKSISKNIQFKSDLNRRVNSEKNIEYIFPVVDENNDPVYYIINFSGGGYIILAADQRSIPLLAYSEVNNFPVNLDDYPSELVDWLEFAKNQIKEIRDNDLEQPREFVTMWEEYNDLITLEENDQSFEDNESDIQTTSSSCTPSFQQYGPLLNTSWNQTAGYNNLMPTASQVGCSSFLTGNNRAYAGCVPIAIAQVMRYHNYPTNFNWSVMPNHSGSTTTSELIYDIHQKIINPPNTIFNPSPLTYYCDGTGVKSSYNVGNLFKNKYNYSTAQYNTQFQMPHPIRMQLEILQNRPVILDGGRKSGWWIFASRRDGHMWVCDGFTRQVLCVTLRFPPITIQHTITRFHMNWGWGGAFNGYFTYGNFNPGSSDFNYKVNVLYNINP